MGEPTSNILYRNTYVPSKDDEWSAYTFPEPVDAPNGFMIAVAYYGFIGLGIDGDGDKERYPFMPNCNCYASDFTTGRFAYLENAGFPANFLLRPVAIPYEVKETVSKFVSPFKATAMNVIPSVYPEASNLLTVSNFVDEEMQTPIRAIEDRKSYNVYRFKNTDMGNAESWLTLAHGMIDLKSSYAECDSRAQGHKRCGEHQV